MRTRTEIRPTGTNAQTDFAHQQGRQVNDELQFFDSQSVKIERTTRGIRLHANIPPPATKKNASLREYDKTKSDYKDGDRVIVSPDNEVVTDGVVDPDSNLLTKAVPGIYQYVSQASPIVSTNGQPDQYHIPTWPPPQYSLEVVYTDDPPNYPDMTDKGIADNKIFWFLESAYPWPLCTKDNAGNTVPRIVNAAAFTEPVAPP